MHGPINVKSPNNISEWQMGFNSAFKGLMYVIHKDFVGRPTSQCTGGEVRTGKSSLLTGRILRKA